MSDLISFQVTNNDYVSRLYKQFSEMYFNIISENVESPKYMYLVKPRFNSKAYIYSSYEQLEIIKEKHIKYYVSQILDVKYASLNYIVNDYIYQDIISDDVNRYYIVIEFYSPNTSLINLV